MSRSSRVLGRYVLYDEIATGGMASVHIGRHVGPHGFCRTVAIKRLHEQYARDPEFVAMFLDEARLAARIHHPNVVSMLDVVTTARELCLVMEYVHGQDLARLLRRHRARRGGGVDPALAAALVGDALRGLHAAHIATDAEGAPLSIVHRDVSPHNILVGFDGRARVLDFGVAKAASRSQVTREGTIKGKLAYMSPEQVRTETVDARTDVFAAGIVLWEMLTGRRLFTRDDPGATVHDILMRERTPPSHVEPAVPAALDEVALCALEIDASRRFASAAEMASALDAAQRPAAPERVAAWVRELDGEQLAERREQLRAIEQIPVKELVEEVTSADADIASSLRDALRILQDREDRAQIATAVDALATRHDAVAVDIPPPARSKRRLWIVAAVSCVGVALAAAFGSAPSPARAHVVLPSDLTIEPPPAATGIASAAPSIAPAASSAKPPARQKPNCTPNYYYEGGIKRYKRHCL